MFHRVYFSFWHLLECIALRTEYVGRGPAECLFSFWDLLVIVLPVGCCFSNNKQSQTELLLGYVSACKLRIIKRGQVAGKKTVPPLLFPVQTLTRHDLSFINSCPHDFGDIVIIAVMVQQFQVKALHKGKAHRGIRCPGRLNSKSVRPQMCVLEQAVVRS